MSIFNIFKPIQRRVRMFFRQRMLPMTVDEAEEKREFFAKIYFLSSISIFTLLLYGCYEERIRTTDRSVSLAEATVDKLKINGPVRIVKFDGIKKVEDYYYQRKEEKTEDKNLDPEVVVDTASNLES